jgi:hypothetical protein
MTTPQDSPRRRKQKARRTKQLAAWRARQAKKGATPKPAKKAGSGAASGAKGAA